MFASALVAEDAAVRVARCCTFVARRGFTGPPQRDVTDPISGLTCGVVRERATGIEPAFSAWEADVLPLNYARENPANLHAGQTRTASARASPGAPMRVSVGLAWPGFRGAWFGHPARVAQKGDRTI